MKIYIFADMEGISGIAGSSYVLGDGPLYQEGRRHLTADVNACAKACFEAGADQVTVRDGHGAGLSVIWEDLAPGVRLVQGPTPGRRFFGLEGTDGMILLGYHAMAGTRDAHLEHTYSSRTVQNLWLNGTRAGEFAMDTVIAGEHGVPVIMTSGCDRLCQEAKAFHPDVVACQVKTSISQQSALLLGPEEARRRIHDDTLRAIRLLRAGGIRPVSVSPATLRVEFCERMEPACGLAADRVREATSDSPEKAFFEVF